MNAQMYEDIAAHIKKVPGDVIDFRVYKSASFTHLAKIAQLNNRHAYGMDTFTGLVKPTDNDFSRDHYILYPLGYAKSSKEVVKNALSQVDPKVFTLYGGPLAECISNIPEDVKFSVAIVDLLQYAPTKHALAYLKTKLVDGGLIYFKNYYTADLFGGSKAVHEFLTDNMDNIEELDNPGHYNRQPYQVGFVVSHNSHQNHTSVDVMPDKVASDLKVTIALVLKTGGDVYNSRYVNALAHNIKMKTTIDVEIALLTNDSTGVDMDVVDRIIPLVDNLNGWWSKIELFRPDIFDANRVLYFDLDTVIVDNIDDIIKNQSEFAGLVDFMSQPRFQTGVMLWEPSKYHHIYHEFIKDPKHVMARHLEGDAGWIRENIKNKTHFQDVLPNRIVSFKVHCYNAAKKYINIPKSASVVCFHGKPRPHTITDYKITKHWKY